MAASWVRGERRRLGELLAMVSPRKADGLLATTSPATTSAVMRPPMWNRDQRAESPLPRSMKRASRTTGVARVRRAQRQSAVVSV